MKVVRSRLSILRQILQKRSRGPKLMTSVGRSHCPMQGAYYFEDYSDIEALDKINWDAVQARQWSGNGISRSVKEGKQAEFLVEEAFPWRLVERIGVHSQEIAQRVYAAMNGAGHRPKVEIRKEWYY